MPQLDIGIYIFEIIMNFYVYWCIYIYFGIILYPYINKVIKLRNIKINFFNFNFWYSLFILRVLMLSKIEFLSQLKNKIFILLINFYFYYIIIKFYFYEILLKIFFYFYLKNFSWNLTSYSNNIIFLY